MEARLNKRRVKAEVLKPAAYNPRLDLQPGDPKYEQIKASILRNGYVDPIIWNEYTGNIVGGHQRYKILRELGADEIDVSVVHIENLDDEKALNIRLNKLSNEFEPIKLSELLKEMQDAGYVFGDLAFEDSEVEEVQEAARKKRSNQAVREEDDIPEEDVPTVVQMGDVWELGPHRMMCGDSTSRLDVDALMEGRMAQLVLTDPPYNVSYESADGKSIENDSMEDAQFYTFLLDAFQNMRAYTEQGGSAYIFHADTEGLNFREAFIDAGFTLGQTCIWVKDSLVLGRSPYQWQHEPCLYGWIGDRPKWYGDEEVTSVWEFPKPKKSEEHPTMKPVALLAVPIINSTAPGDLVIDFFGGSGSTLIACDRADRVCYTMEYDPKYASVIVARYKKERPEETIRVFRDGEWEVWEG